MSLLTRLFGGDEERSVSWESFSRDTAALVVGNGLAESGEAITEESALRVSAVYACVRLLAEPCATLPTDVFVPTPEGTRRPYRKPAWMARPNPLKPEQSWIVLVQQIAWSLLLWGDAFVATYRDPNGRVVGLVPLDPDLIQPDVDPMGRRIYWATGQADPLGSKDVLHIPGPMMPGADRGLSPIRKLAIDTIGVAAGAQRYGAKFFGNSAIPGMVVEAPNDMSAENQRLLKQNWNEIHRGAGNAHRVAVLTNGAKLSKTSLAPNEAQFIETRQFSISDIARYYGVPPHLVADASNSTSWGSGLEEQNNAFLQFALSPWIARLEDGLTRLVQSDFGMASNAYVKFNTGALLRGTLKERLEAYAIGINMGLYCLDDCRALEDLPPLPDGLGAKFRAIATIRPLDVIDTQPVKNSPPLSDSVVANEQPDNAPPEPPA